MNYPVKNPSIVVFENTYRNADNQPVKNVLVNLPNGTVLKGGLWEVRSKNGLQYLSGSLQNSKEWQVLEKQLPTRSAKQEPEVDFG